MKITVIGAAGTLGSCSAFALTTQCLADEIVMIDTRENMLTAHWLDLSTVASSRDIRLVKGTYADMAGSDIVIATACAPEEAIKDRKELLPGNLPIIIDIAAEINRCCPEAIVITETNPVDPLNFAMYLLSKSRDRRKFIGYSLNDTLRFRRWASEALGVPTSCVEGTVIGEHGHSQVMLFSSLKVNGKPVELAEETKRRIRQMPRQLILTAESLKPKRTAGWTSAFGTAAIVSAIKNDTREVIQCNCVLDGEYGFNNISMTVPAVVGKDGIESIKELELAADEQVGLGNTVSVLTPYMQYIKERLGTRS